MITDNSIEYLCKLKLYSLNISKCSNITNVGFYNLTKINTLMILKISNCNKISTDEMKQLINNIPHFCNITELCYIIIYNYIINHIVYSIYSLY